MASCCGGRPRELAPCLVYLWLKLQTEFEKKEGKIIAIRADIIMTADIIMKAVLKLYNEGGCMEFCPWSIRYCNKV